MSSRPDTSSQSGASLVEAAIVLPLVFLLIFGVIDTARLLATHNAVRTASREAARYGSSVGTNASGDERYVDCAGIRDAGMGLTTPLDIAATQVTIEYDSGPSTVVKATCPIGGPQPDPASLTNGDRIVVTTSHQFTPVTPLIGDLIGVITVTSVDRRSILSP
ncbi:MAG: TadE/TadG family type IV pilus assembly protein [Acidimicrobiia bacterium]|nr:TadE/TadG family type IV pilus assembly protein [Acidimicrobiia bacterium]